MSERFLRIYIDLINKCNLKCKMCYFALDLNDEAPKIMSLELFDKIAADIFPKALSVNLSCAAEPLIVPQFEKYLQITKQYGVPETLIVTNALLLDEPKIRALIDNKIDQVDISIDGATKSTYESIRKGSDFDRVISNVNNLQRIKKESGSEKPLLYLDYALMKSTLYELPDFLKMAAELGADNVRVNHLIPFKSLNIMDESLVNFKVETNKVLAECRDIIERLGLRADIPKDFIIDDKIAGETVVNKSGCKVPFESFYIASDGSVLPCIWFSMKEYCVGNFKESNFDSIWQNEVYERLLRDFNEGKYVDECRNCPVYGGGDISNYIFSERLRKDVGNISSHEI